MNLMQASITYLRSDQAVPSAPFSAEKVIKRNGRMLETKAIYLMYMYLYTTKFIAHTI